MAEDRSGHPLRIGFNARLLFTPMIRGWNRYTINLLAELPSVGIELILYTDRPVHAVYLDRLPAGSYSVRLGEGMHLPVWEHRWLPRRCREDGVDVLHSPFNFGIPWSSPCPRVLTLHDAINLMYYRRREGRFAGLGKDALRSRLDHWVARSRAERIITVSQHARNDLATALGIPDRKLRVVPEAADPLFLEPVTAEARARIRARHTLPSRYIFYVGGWELRKNIPFLLRAFAAADLGDVGLVLAGGRPSERGVLSDLATSLRIGDRLVLLEWVEDEDLPALYAEALAFAYPSEYEGFGLQLCEAMAVGCPALASRASCLPEVLGDGGATFALDDIEELVGLLRRVSADEAFRAELTRRGLARASTFSWRKTAEQTAAVYRELVGRSGPIDPGAGANASRLDTCVSRSR